MIEDSAQIITDKIFDLIDLNGQSVLEVGCGNGRITSLLVGKPRNLVAIDTNQDDITKAKIAASDADVRLGSGEDLEFSGNSFDVVLFTLSLHHQKSALALNEAKRVLKSKGSVIIIEPVISGEVEKVFSFIDNEDSKILDAQKAIQESGIKIKHSEAFSAKWYFSDKEDLANSLFSYYGFPVNLKTFQKISDHLGMKVDDQPIILKDELIIYLLSK